MLSSQALRGSSSFLVNRQGEDVGPRVVTGENVDFVVVVVHSFREFYKATANLALFIVNQERKMANRRSGVLVESVDDAGLGVFVLDVPFGGEIPDGPVDRVVVQ